LTSEHREAFHVGLIVALLISFAVADITAPATVISHARFSIPFSLSTNPSKFTLDAPSNLLARGNIAIIARQGQLPSNVNLYVYYAWCSDSASGGQLYFEETGGAGWLYNLVCPFGSGGTTSSGDPGSSSPIFTATITTTNTQYQIIEQNTNGTTTNTVQGGFVVSATKKDTQPVIPGLSSASFTNIFQIPTGQTLYVWFESGNAAGCASGTLVCYIGINPVVSGGNCRLDVSGGSFMTSGSVDSVSSICTISGNSAFAWEAVLFNGDTVPHFISGIFVVSIF